ncbi:MAG: hypothetical protein ACI8TQ_000805 [Planctomycetota bacterium]|jgi:hypothetical protein
MRRSVSKLQRYAVTLGVFAIASGGAHAGVGDQIAKLLPDDGAANKFFGISVATSGDLVLVGSPRDNDNGVLSGSATLFDATTGAQVLQVVPSDGGVAQQFGISVGMSGSIAVVGAIFDNDNGGDSGSAYLFNTNTGLQIAKLLPSDGAASDNFGNSVAISGTTVIVGAPRSDSDGSDSGSAYLFDAVTGLQTAKLTASDAAAGDFFGFSVGIHGNTVIVSAEGTDVNGANSGSAYLFDASTGAELMKLLPSDGAATDFFGTAVAVNQTMAIVGARGDADSGGFLAGSAYLFDLGTGAQVAKLLATTGAIGDQFGVSVAINGTTALVGAEFAVGNVANSGSAYTFDPMSGVQLAQITVSDGASNDRFGHTVALDGPRIVIGSYLDTENGSNSGSAYVIEGQSLLGDASSLSLGTGGALEMNFEAGTSRAGWFYSMFGSVTGTTPGIDFGSGVVLPLNFDAYFNLTLLKPGLGAFGNFVGMLDGDGQSTSTLTIPILTDPSLVGVVMSHAYVAGSVIGVAEFASNAFEVMLVP